jgi:Fibronectin type III domain
MGNRIGLSWTPSTFNSGAATLDYMIECDQGLFVFTVLETGISGTSYIATTLTPGVSYRFRVSARNS